MAEFELNGKTILVTGGTGFIGSAVVARLFAAGAAVRVLARDIAKARQVLPINAEIVHGDIADAGAIARAIRGCRAVFHFAAVLGDEFKPPAYFRKINVEGTRLLARAALAESVERFVHTSTAWVYGARSTGCITEESPRRTTGLPYCDTKLEAEQLVREFIDKDGLPAVIIQPTDAYGPGDETYTLGPLKLIASGDMILPAGGEGLINAVYIDDLAQGILLAAKKGGVGRSYLLASPETVTCREFFGCLARIAGRKKPLPSVPGWAALAFAGLLEQTSRITKRPPLFTREAVRATLIRCTFDGSKAYRELGFSPHVNVEAGMQRVEAWYRILNNAHYWHHRDRLDTTRGSR